MGRKNKTKLLKHGSQSLNASTITEADGRASSNGNHHVDFEAISTQLREFVSSGTIPERHREMTALFTTLEKRDAELHVAKQLINKLKTGVPADHNGDGDSSLAPNEDTFSESPHGHNGISIVDELDHLRRQNEDLIHSREKLTLELVSTEENVAGLKDQVRALETKLDNAEIVLKEGSQSTAIIINELKQSLKSSDETVKRLTADVESQRSSYRNTCDQLDLEKSRRMEQEEQLARSIQLDKQRTQELQQLVLDNEKLESRYDSINNGVQLIKKDFDEVKSNLVKSNEQVQDLQQQLTASKADVKHYRDNEDACRKYIKKLEESIQQVRSSTEKELFELQERYTSTQIQLQKAADEMSVKTDSEQKLLKELQNAFQTENITSVFEAVRELRENFKREQHKLVFQSAALEGKEVALQKQIQQNKDLLESIENDYSRKEQDKKLMEEDRMKIQDELDQAKLKIKKLSKEKNQTSKRLKNLLAEKSNLLEQMKSLEDKLNQSTSSSQSNESVVSDNSETIDLLEESVKSLRSTLESTEETLSQVSKQLVNKEEETLDLHRTLVAYKSKIDDYENDKVESQKTVTTIQSGMVEQQKLFEVQQKKYEADVSELRQTLKSANADLQIQQELLAKVKLQADALKNEHASETRNLEEQIQQLKSTIASLESEKLRVDALITSSEEDRCKIHEEKKLLEVQINGFQEDLSVKDSLEKENLIMEESLRRAEEENTSLKKSLDQINATMAEAKLSQAEKETTFVEMNQQLENEVEVLRTQIMKQDVEIEKLSSNATVSDQVIKDLINTVNQSEMEHEKVLQSEKAKLEILGKKLEEMTTESSEKVRRLKEREERMEEVRVESEKASQELRDTVQRMENEVAQVVSEKAAMNSEIERFKASIAEKEEEIRNLVNEKSVYASKQQHLENEIDNINKKFEEAMSPKKDKVLQLENRLEVLQTASKSQHKRLEDELSSVRASLEITSEQVESLEKLNAELLQQVQQLDEVQSNNILLNEKLKKAAQLEEIVSDLEKQNKDIQLEIGEERAGLVNELIDAKQKLAERDQQVEDLQKQCKLMESQKIEVEETETHAGPENQTILDSVFPSMDPAVRQLVILLSENRNYSYGVLGLVIYGFLVHLYILWY